ncbi:MAG TPA: hypothetical protein VFK34_14025 [Marmoricola sp.]|nr:hypothetical protein [Marmoricola sp.]
MITHPTRTARRLLTVVSATLVVVLAPVAAQAAVPDAWDDPPKVSGLDFLLVLFLIPLGIALVISVLAALPSMIGDKGYEPGQSWRSQPEWFGGPRQGVEATDGTDARALEGEQGGTSARW